MSHYEYIFLGILNGEVAAAHGSTHVRFAMFTLESRCAGNVVPSKKWIEKVHILVKRTIILFYLRLPITVSVS